MRFRTSTSTFVKVKVLLLREKADREKSTLARLLIGIEKPTSGKILLDGEDITCWNYRTWKQHRKKIQAVFRILPAL